MSEISIDTSEVTDKKSTLIASPENTTQIPSLNIWSLKFSILNDLFSGFTSVILTHKLEDHNNQISK